MQPFVLTITGPSASGKSTLERKLVETGVFERAISTTTRPMRDGEKNGREYYFVSRSMFNRLAARGAFVEYKEFGGHFYGVTSKELTKGFAKGHATILVVEPNGAKRIKVYGRERGWAITSLFMSHDPKELVSRFIMRSPPQNKKVSGFCC